MGLGWVTFKGCAALPTKCAGTQAQREVEIGSKKNERTRKFQNQSRAELDPVPAGKGTSPGHPNSPRGGCSLRHRYLHFCPPAPPQPGHPRAAGRGLPAPSAPGRQPAPASPGQPDAPCVHPRPPHPGPGPARGCLGFLGLPLWQVGDPQTLTLVRWGQQQEGDLAASGALHTRGLTPLSPSDSFILCNIRYVKCLRYHLNSPPVSRARHSQDVHLLARSSACPL